MSEERKYRAVSIYVSLFCGLIILLVGIYLTTTQKILYGLTLPGARSGTAGSAFKPVALPGIGVLYVGIVFLSALPAYYIITNSGKKNSEN
jgi:hypothetical protein